MQKLEMIFIETKICLWCDKEKPLIEFYSQQKHSKKQGDWIYYHPECKECSKKSARKWAINNIETKRASVRKNNKTKNTMEISRKRNQTQRENGYRKQWEENNPDKLIQYRENHKHKIHTLTEKEWIECKKYFNNECAYCGMNHDEQIKYYKQDFHKEHVDHEGANDLSNCIPSCKQCNSEKHIFTLDEWYNPSNLKWSQERYNLIMKWITDDYKNIQKQ